MSNFCKSCGVSIPSGQNFCSMCYGDPAYGSDDGYENYLREKDKEQKDIQHGNEDWEVDPEMGAHG